MYIYVCVYICVHVAVSYLRLCHRTLAHSTRAITTTATSPIRAPLNALSCSLRRLCRYSFVPHSFCFAAAGVVFVLRFDFAMAVCPSVRRTFHFTSLNFSDTQTNSAEQSRVCRRGPLIPRPLPSSFISTMLIPRCSFY